MEDELEPHEELAELLNGEDEPDLNGEVKPDLNATGEQEEETPPSEEEEPAEVETPEPEEEVPPTSEEADAKFQAMLAKSQDEVAKRQAAEAVNAELRRQNEELKAAQQPKIDPYEDFEGYQKQQQEIQAQQAMNQRLELSELVLKELHEDYDEVTAIFTEEARQNPAMAQAMFASSSPAKYAYTEGKRIQSMREIGDDPEAFKASLREQLKAEVLAEIKGAEVPKKETLPPTIANAGTKAPKQDDLPADDLASLLGET